MVAAGTWVWRDGSRLTPVILANLNRLDAEFYAVWGVRILASSGIRTDAEQEAIFRERYVPVSQVNGRRVYDYRWWNGIQWARISSAGTVAAPGSSNHQINVAADRRGAVDVRDSGADAGILTAGSPRARWLVANAPRFGFNTDEGYAVGEPWHLRYLWDPWADAPAPASTGATPITFDTEQTPTEEDDMRIIVWAGHYFSVGREAVKYEHHMPHIQRLARIYQPGELGIGVDNGGIDALQLSLGIPWRAFEITLRGQGFNNNGDHGTNGDGRYWSRQMEILDALHGSASVLGDVTRTLDEVQAILEKTPAPVAAS